MSNVCKENWIKLNKLIVQNKQNMNGMHFQL